MKVQSETKITKRKIILLKKILLLIKTSYKHWIDN